MNMVEVLNVLLNGVHTPLSILFVILIGLRFNIKFDRVNGKNKVSVSVSFRFKK